ncbi:hypothetical protein [Microbacterium sp. AG238]|uniref:hypothetical protein n=1 Tax=Microbacterium sp. AG238 TaxID=2183994 RepID=UPI0011C45C15|nr:hypothetical protein [Microbacterium sp. AG238]
MKPITSITTKRDGILDTKVSVITAGNTVDFRVSHAEAKIVKDTLTQLMTGGTPPVQAEPTGTPVSSAPLTVTRDGWSYAMAALRRVRWMAGVSAVDSAGRSAPLECRGRLAAGIGVRFGAARSPFTHRFARVLGCT